MDFNINQSNPLFNFLAYNPKKLVLFGASWHGEKFYDSLSRAGFTVDYFCDNDEKKWGSFLCGKRVISPVELLRDRADRKVLIVSGSFSSIYVQLDSLGMEDVFDWCLIAKRICSQSIN